MNNDKVHYLIKCAHNIFINFNHRDDDLLLL